MSSPSTEKNSTDNKWLELYFIRYFVGTIVGGATALYLNTSGTSQLFNLIIPQLHAVQNVADVSNMSAQVLLLLAAIGLAFCYISSAPVLVLHATRGLVIDSDNKLYDWLVRGTILLTTAVSVWHYYDQPVPDLRGAIAIFVLATITLLQFINIFFSLTKNGELSHVYYRNLTKARSRDTEEARQHIESYRQLREHGNAFLILICEMALGIILASAPTPNLAFVALLVWITPAAMVWGVGTILEYRFAKVPPKHP